MVQDTCIVCITVNGVYDMEDITDADMQRLPSLFDTCGLQQHVSVPTHLLGGTVDLMATFSGCKVSDVSIISAGII